MLPPSPMVFLVSKSSIWCSYLGRHWRVPGGRETPTWSLLGRISLAVVHSFDDVFNLSKEVSLLEPPRLKMVPSMNVATWFSLLVDIDWSTLHLLIESMKNSTVVSPTPPVTKIPSCPRKDPTAQLWSLRSKRVPVSRVQDFSGSLGVERDFVFYQEFLIPGASVGILECTHFSEWFGYNHTRWVCVPDILLEVNRKSSQDEKIIWNKCISSSFFLPGKSWDTNNCSQESENFNLAIKKIFQATINFLKWSSPYLVFDSWSERL